MKRKTKDQLITELTTTIQHRDELLQEKKALIVLTSIISILLFV